MKKEVGGEAGLVVGRGEGGEGAGRTVEEMERIAKLINFRSLFLLCCSLSISKLDANKNSLVNFSTEAELPSVRARTSSEQKRVNRRVVNSQRLERRPTSFLSNRKDEIRQN